MNDFENMKSILDRAGIEYSEGNGEEVDVILLEKEIEGFDFHSTFTFDLKGNLMYHEMDSLQELKPKKVLGCYRAPPCNSDMDIMFCPHCDPSRLGEIYK